MIESVYIHIPFCHHICSYCDFCKVFYNEKQVSFYLEALQKEIEKAYQGEPISTLYIGGGTPSSLNATQLETLFSILAIFHKKETMEYTIECNIEDITEEKVLLFQKYGINRISIGIQTFHQKYLTLLERNHTFEEVKDKIEILRKYGLYNINLDLMYAFEKETLEELEKDITLYLSLGVPHLSTYSLIIEPHTKLYLKKAINVNEEIEADMYERICKRLCQSGYVHYELSNFAKEGFFSNHNLTYWNHQYYYGFGAGASGYLPQKRYENTKSIPAYIKGKTKIEEYEIIGNDSIYETIMLGFRKIKGIQKDSFYKEHHQYIEKIPVIKKMIQENKIIETIDSLYINSTYLYVMNEILVEILEEIEGVPYA